MINGSASTTSSNERLIQYFIAQTNHLFDVSVVEDLKKMPHFDPQKSVGEVPDAVQKFRKDVSDADAVLMCTPEYVFSIPSGLKNVIEWSVSTTIFSDKTLGIITASAHGEKGHEELQLIMKTLMARFNTNTTLLIKGIKGKFSASGEVSDEELIRDLSVFIEAFKALVDDEPTLK